MERLNIKWEWEPNISVGPVRFDEAPPLDLMRHFEVDQEQLEKNEKLQLPSEDRIEWHESFDQTVSIKLSMGVVQSVFLWNSLLHKDFELIGSDPEDVKKRLPGQWTVEGSEEMNDIIMTNYSVGIMIWLQDGIVESASVRKADAE